MSCIFMSCHLVRQFHVRHFHVQHFQRPQNDKTRETVRTYIEEEEEEEEEKEEEEEVCFIHSECRRCSTSCLRR